MLNIREDKRFTKSTENHDSVLGQAKQLLEKINRSTGFHTGYLRFLTFLAVSRKSTGNHARAKY